MREQRTSSPRSTAILSSLTGAALALGASGCPPLADLGEYTSTGADTSGGAGPGTDSATGGASGGGPTTGESTGGSTGDSPGSGESTAGLSGDTEAPSGSSTGGSSGSESTGGESSSTGEPALVCGDGVVTEPEQCDDGNDDELDGCKMDCSFGPGAKIGVVALPGKLGDEEMHFVTAVKNEFVDADNDVLVIGGIVPDFLPKQIAAHVQQVPLPDGGAAYWSYLEVAGINGRWPGPMATAANGDVILAGLVYTEQQKVDTGGYLWLARFAPDGQIVWSHEVPEIYTQAEDLELTPAGEIVIVGRAAAFSNLPPDVYKFAADGSLIWEYHEPYSPTYATSYDGVAIAEDGTVYVAGYLHFFAIPHEGQTILRALSPEGALLWAVAHVAPTTSRTGPADLVWTADDVLMLAAGRYDDGPNDALMVGGFDTDGGLLWWKEWGPLPGWRVRPKRVRESPDGGVFVGGSLSMAQTWNNFVARFDAQGALVWWRMEEDDAVEDLVLAPDGFLYTVTRQALTQYLP